MSCGGALTHFSCKLGLKKILFTALGGCRCTHCTPPGYAYAVASCTYVASNDEDDGVISIIERTRNSLRPFITLHCLLFEVWVVEYSRQSIYESLSRNVAVVRVVSISNIIISIIITDVEEPLNDVKMMRLAIAILVLSVMFAGNSLTQRSVYHEYFVTRSCGPSQVTCTESDAIKIIILILPLFASYKKGDIAYTEFPCR